MPTHTAEPCFDVTIRIEFREGESFAKGWARFKRAFNKHAPPTALRGRQRPHKRHHEYYCKPSALARLKELRHARKRMVEESDRRGSPVGIHWACKLRKYRRQRYGYGETLRCHRPKKCGRYGCRHNGLPYAYRH